MDKMLELFLHHLHHLQDMEAFHLNLNYPLDGMMSLCFHKYENDLKILKNKRPFKSHLTRSLTHRIGRTWTSSGRSSPTTTSEESCTSFLAWSPTVTSQEPNNFYLDYMNVYGMLLSLTLSVFFDELECQQRCLNKHEMLLQDVLFAGSTSDFPTFHKPELAVHTSSTRQSRLTFSTSTVPGIC